MRLDKRREKRKDNKRNAVIDLFRRHGTLSKIQVRTRSRYAMSTVLDIFDYLSSKKIILPSNGKTAETRRGRKAEYFSLNERKYVYLGVTFTQTGIYSAFVSFTGTVLGSKRTELDLAGGAPYFLERFTTHLEEIKKEDRSLLPAIRSIGLSLPGTVDAERGILRSYTLMPRLENIDFGAHTRAVFPDRAIVAGNNVSGFLSYFLFDRNLIERYRTIALVSLRAGPSLGIIHDGAIVAENGELGHVCVSDEKKRCICGRNGCLDLYLSQQALSSGVRDVLGAKSKTNLRGHLSAEDIARLYRGGDTRVRRFIDVRFAIFARALVDVINLHAPDALILTGEIFSCFDDPVAVMRSSIAFSYADTGYITNLRRCDILYRNLGTEIAAIGICYRMLKHDFDYEPE